jgi:type IV secretory pathway VirB10-like protein
MAGVGQGGHAGLHDRANTHFWPKIGNALLISIAAASVQLSPPQVVARTTTRNRSQQQRSVSNSASWGKNTRVPVCRSRTLSKFT